MIIFEIIIMVLIVILCLRSSYSEWMYIVSMIIAGYAFLQLYIAGYPFVAILMFLIDLIGTLLIRNYIEMIYPKNKTILRFSQYKQPLSIITSLLLVFVLTAIMAPGLNRQSNSIIELYGNDLSIHYATLSVLLFFVIRRTKWVS